MASSVNLGSFLLTELQTLSTEARRKHPEVKDAAERVIVLLRGIKSPADTSSELREHDDTVRPFALACQAASGSHGGGSSKMAGTAMQCLQQLVLARALSARSVGEALRTLKTASQLGAVDVQVKVLQMILPLVTLYPESVVGAELVEALHICLGLQKTRDAVVGNTAAAILRQAVEEVFERVSRDDKGATDEALEQQHQKDALFILQDLCLLASDAEPVFLQAAGTMDRRLVLELLESILANHSAVVARHAPMAQVLRERLAPFLVGFFADTAPFTLAVRCTRILWLFVCELRKEMRAECEVFLGIVARLVGAESPLPGFYRVLALETVRRVAEHRGLLLDLFAQYDGDAEADDCHVIGDLLAAICKVAIERPELRSAAEGIAASDANGAQVSTRCGVRTDTYKLLDKSEAPAIPPEYVFSQAFSVLVALGDALAAHILPPATQLVGSDQVLRADAKGLDTGAQGALAVQMWPVLVPAYEFIMGVRLDDTMFARALDSAQKLVCVWTALGLVEPRNAMLGLLCRCAQPGVQAEASSSGLRVRHVQCLLETLSCARYLVLALRDAWYPVLGVLQQIEELAHQASGLHLPQQQGRPAAELIRAEMRGMFTAARNAGPEAYLWVARALILLSSDLNGVPVTEGISTCIETKGLHYSVVLSTGDRPSFALEELRLFAVSDGDCVLMDGTAWQMITQHLLAAATFVGTPADARAQACGALSDVVLAAMGLVARGEALEDATEFRALVRTGEAQLRILGPLAQMMTAQVSGFGEQTEFGLFVEVRRVALDTLHRLLQASGHSVGPAWDVVFDIIQSVFARGDNAPGAEDVSKQAGVLVRGVFPCVQLVCSDYLADLSPRCLRRCIEALAQFGRQRDDLNIALTAIGQAWALSDFFQAESAAAGSKSPAAMAPLASSQLALDDGTSVIDDSCVDQIVTALWAEDLADRGVRTRQVLWVLLLHALATLGRDARHEVRLGAIQTLFRTLDSHARSFDAWTWDALLWVAVLPLLGHVLGRRGHVLDLIRRGKIDQLLAEEDAGGSHDQERVASKSGVYLEDPRRLYRRQWDETVATAMQGAVRTWCDHAQADNQGPWSAGAAAQAWCRLWSLVGWFLVGDASAGERSGSGSMLEAQPDESASFLRTRESVRAAIDCAGVLAGSTYSGTDVARTAWAAWLRMGLLLGHVPVTAPAEFNRSVENSNVVVSQETLCALLKLGHPIAQKLAQFEALSLTDCSTLLVLVRRMLVFADAPLQTPDTASMSALQQLALDAVGLVEQADAAMGLGELAMLAVAPYVVRMHGASEGLDTDALLRGQAVVGRALDAFAQPLARAEHLRMAATGGARQPPSTTLVALATAALDRLGLALSRDAERREEGFGQLLLALLLGGAWQDAIAAMGLHLVHPLGAQQQVESSAAADWFVRVVPPGMLCLRDLVNSPDSSDDMRRRQAALRDAWDSLGTVLALALGMPLDEMAAAAMATTVPAVAAAEQHSGLDSNEAPPSNGQQIRLLDAVMDASLQYVVRSDKSPSDATQSPPLEMSQYWATLINVLEWGAQEPSEPVVLACADDRSAAVDARRQDLAMACLRWLFDMSAGSLAGDVLPLWVSEAAAPRMVGRCRAVLEAFVADRKLLGRRSPMPVRRIELLRLVLGGLARLECRSGALASWQQQEQPAANVDVDVDVAEGSRAEFRRHAMMGSSAHIFALYDSLVALVGVSADIGVVGFVQTCLRRVFS
ncbi:Endocytosis and vacuole integrity protein [Coemansia sp. Benny D115]|nr:Endocytosis and vacuole integrity protein [Coemansia sp. Benny D115]